MAGHHRAALTWLAIGLALAMPSASRAELLDAVVAVVEGRPILLSELRELREGLAADGEAVTRPADLVERRIEDILVERRAETLGLTVTERDIDDAVARIASQNGMTPDDLYSAVAAQGLSQDDYRRVLRDQLRRMRIAQREIEPRVRVDRADMLAWMRRHADRFGAAPQARLRILSLGRSEAEALAGCEPLPGCASAERLATAADRLDDVSPLLVNWGDLEGELQTWIADNPTPGELRLLTGAAPGQWLLVRFDALVPGELVALDGVRDEVEAEVRREKMDAAFRGWLTELKRDALIERYPLPVSAP